MRITATPTQIGLLVGVAQGRVYAGPRLRAPVAAGLVDAAPSIPGYLRGTLTVLGRAVLSAGGHCGGCGVDAEQGLPTTVCLHTCRTNPAVCLDGGCRTWDLCPDCWHNLIGGGV